MSARLDHSQHVPEREHRITGTAGHQNPQNGAVGRLGWKITMTIREINTEVFCPR